MTGRAVKCWRSDETLLADALDRVRTAMRAGVFTTDFFLVGGNRDSHRSWVTAWYVLVSEGIAVHLLASRDVGHHTSGWWKNPDYERCEHLSLSMWDAAKDRTPIPFDAWIAERIVEWFFRPASRLVWMESPTTDGGKAVGAHHYRVFCDDRWQPILPRGEVYTREFTAAGWQSWSDVQAAKAAALEAR